eukprot:gene24852-5362_t
MNLAFFGPGFGGAAPAAAYFVPPGGNAFGGIGGNATMDCLAASFDAVTIERGPVVGRELQLQDLSETFGD